MFSKKEVDRGVLLQLQGNHLYFLDESFNDPIDLIIW